MFVDSSGFFSAIDRDDKDHERAIAIQNALTRVSAGLFTSNFVIAESHALFLSRLGRRTALAFLDGLESSDLTIVRIDPDDEIRARAIIRQYDDKNFSYVDASSFAVMERLGIQDVFSFDRNFAQYGFRSLDVSALEAP